MALDIFRKHRIVLRCLGILLPGDLKDRFLLRTIITAWNKYMSVMFPVLTLCFLIGVLTQRQDYPIMASMYAIAGVISSACVGMKYLTLCHYKQDVKELVEFLKGFRADTRLGRLTFYLSILVESLAIGLRVVVLVEIIVKGKLKLIMPFWTPFPRTSVPVTLATYVFFQGSAIIKTITNFFIDTLFLLISNQTCHRLLILSNTFKMIGMSDEEKKEHLKGKHVMELPPGMEFTDENLLKLCVREHIALLKVVDKFGTILNRLFLPQVTNAFLSLCVVMFIITQAPSMVGEAIKTAPWTTVIFMQLFVSCFSGELIKTRCYDIFNTSYGNSWYNSNNKIKTSLLIVQTYTTKPKVLRGAYVFELSLHTFESAVKEIFSTFTVLYQLFNEK